MAAGLGFKDFTTGEVLTAADVDGYLMQGIWVFASAAARDAAVTLPQEGNFAFLKDTNVTTYYTGSAWTNLDTTGMVNPMTTTGDTIYSSSGSTPARLGIGTAGQVLQVNSGATAPEWATPASGGMTLISTTTLTGGTVNLSSIPGTYNKLQLFFRGLRPTSDNATTVIRVNGDSTASRYLTTSSQDNGNSTFADDLWTSSNGIDNTATTGFGMLELYDYANTSTWKTALGYYAFVNATTTTNISYSFFRHIYNQTGAITEINLSTVGGGGANTWAGGTVLLYGVK